MQLHFPVCMGDHLQRRPCGSGATLAFRDLILLEIMHKTHQLLDKIVKKIPLSKQADHFHLLIMKQENSNADMLEFKGNYLEFKNIITTAPISLELIIHSGSETPLGQALRALRVYTNVKQLKTKSTSNDAKLHTCIATIP